MTTDDLRTRAREAAKKRGQPRHWTAYENGYIDGYLAHAAQQPSREQIVDALVMSPLSDTAGVGLGPFHETADAILALLDRVEDADLSSRVERNLDDLDHAEADRNIWRDQADRAEVARARVEAAIRLVSPEHITPQGARIIRAALTEERK